MLYYDKVNKELKEYFLTLCNNDYPEFIEKYLDTKPLKRIGGIGFFCGADYTNIFNIKYFYSRLDHSISCSLIVWYFTKDKAKTLMALFHDLGTPCFSHTIDYLFGDSEKQESSEKDVFDVISSSDEIINLLRYEKITIDDLKQVYKCTIVENERPKICADRLDGIFQIVLNRCSFWDLKDLKSIYNNLEILNNEYNEKEIGFSELNKANAFFDAAYKYSMELQSSEDKYQMKFIADCLKILIDNEIITLDDLYKKEEREIVELLREHITCFNEFEEAKGIERSLEKPDCYFVSKDAKRRYVIPLCNHNGKNYRLNEISDVAKEKIDLYLKYKDSKYAYIPSIKEIKRK